MKQTTNKFEMSLETEAMFDAYKNLVDFEDVYFKALTKIYGEEQANEIYSQETDKFKDLEKVILGHIGYSVKGQLSVGHEGETAIII